MVDFSRIYVMTSEYGAASQLEKIDMLDYADLVVLNKYDQAVALKTRCATFVNNGNAIASAILQGRTDEATPVYPTIASQFNDPGISWMFVRTMSPPRATR